MRDEYGIISVPGASVLILSTTSSTCLWFIKSHLESAYLLQSSKTVAFLPYIATGDDSRTVKDLIPMLNQLQHLHALPKPVIIDQEPEAT